MDPTLVRLSFIIFTMVEKYYPAIFTNHHLPVGYYARGAAAAAAFIHDTTRTIKSFHQMPLPKIFKQWHEKQKSMKPIQTWAVSFLLLVYKSNNLMLLLISSSKQTENPTDFKHKNINKE